MLSLEKSDLIRRRELLLSAIALVLLPARTMASAAQLNDGDDGATISWNRFQEQMTALAEAEVIGSIEQKSVADNGMLYLKQLGINSKEFISAVDACYETGNRYWLWQRLMKTRNINGGILTIASDQLVQLHDHPGATGMLRIISGETEVWQFDLAAQGKEFTEQGDTELVRVAHRVLKPGDMALLTPYKGNIHALRAISKECRMLDFFIPPYEKSQRNWYEPLEKKWFNKKRLACRKIPQHASMKA